MIETEIAAMIDTNATISGIVDGRIMDQDFRASDWENAVNYKEEPITILDRFGFINSCIVVDGGDIQRSLNLRGAGRFMQPVTIWIFTPGGRQGYMDNRTIRNKIVRLLHENTVPSRPMMMLQQAVGPLADEKNLLSRVVVHATFIPQEA